MRKRDIKVGMKVGFTGKDDYFWGYCPRNESYGIVTEIDSSIITKLYTLSGKNHPDFVPFPHTFSPIELKPFEGEPK